MPIIHIILFEFNPTVTPAQVEDVCQRMLALKDTCIHPTTQKPYVKSYGGGRDNSPEGHQVSRLPRPLHFYLQESCTDTNDFLPPTFVVYIGRLQPWLRKRVPIRRRSEVLPRAGPGTSGVCGESEGDRGECQGCGL